MDYIGLMRAVNRLEFGETSSETTEDHDCNNCPDYRDFGGICEVCKENLIDQAADNEIEDDYVEGRRP